ncbi:MAG: PRC-barrel domain-containing protein [Candidatus Marsarchaeota archaeon]|jgi:sporulation protein YlmC with PRC-barrel domain|nr:PRC-barrel domain-containing protein [Candidatus Marsarchaeota archaeon]MCL5112175.1 PRC-barrel domain-containing protein [Candidatus Marsarchaeota archaeon]
MNMTEIYGMDIYSDSGQYLGEVRDAIVDLESGGISRLLMEEWRSANAAEIKRILKEKSVLFKNIKNISDVVLVSASGQVRHAEAADSSEAADLSSR